MPKRNYNRYQLKDGQKVVYIGITNDPERRVAEHQDEGKRFNRMNIVGPAVTKRSAENWEEESLEKYRRSHGGDNPRYNATDR